MFVRVSVYEIPSEQMDESVKSFTTALDEIGSCDGFQEGFFLVNPEDSRAMAVTFWTSRAAMDASGVTASRLRSEAARSVDGSVVSTQQYEVAAHVGTAGAAAASSREA